MAQQLCWSSQSSTFLSVLCLYVHGLFLRQHVRISTLQGTFLWHSGNSASVLCYSGPVWCTVFVFIIQFSYGFIKLCEYCHRQTFSHIYVFHDNFQSFVMCCRFNSFRARNVDSFIHVLHFCDVRGKSWIMTVTKSYMICLTTDFLVEV